MITPNANFRANPGRAIFVSGPIDHDHVTRLTPAILRIQHESREPITVYIDSKGGAVTAMTTLLRLLTLSDQDASPGCRIITVVTTQAASAAADLLCSGDYVIAYPNSWLLFHGTRNTPDEPLTLEITSRMGKSLRQSNEQFAMELARRIEHRFAFRFMFARAEFSALRLTLGKPAMSDLECFIHYVGEQLAPDANQLWERARGRHLRYKDLFDTVLKKADGAPAPLTRAKLEAKRIKAIVDYEVKSNKKQADWSFTQGGLDKLSDDFFLLNEYLSAAADARLRDWVTRFGKFFLTPADPPRLMRLRMKTRKPNGSST